MKAWKKAVKALEKAAKTLEKVENADRVKDSIQKKIRLNKELKRKRLRIE